MAFSTIWRILYKCLNIMLSRSCRYLVKEYAYHEDVSAVARAVARRLKRLKLG